MSSNIASFYSGKSVFITGATGFLGKVLVEKLLWGCPLIDKVYILIRTKKNDDPSERLNKLLKDVVFKRLSENHPERLNKLVLIDGDVSLDNLGMSDSNRLMLIQNVDIMVHCAAIVKFDEPLLVMGKVNVKGTHRMLQFAELLKEKLKAFVFISTAFSQCYQFDLEEKYYPTGHNVFDVIKWIDSDNSEELEKVEKALLAKKHPSVYTVTKAFSEELVYSYKDKLPVTIVRPSIIVGSAYEPEPGYIFGLQGFSGMVAAAMTGLFRSSWSQGDVAMNMIPVDFVANTIISVTHERAQNKELGECPYYNSTNSMNNKITNLEMQPICHDEMYKNPLNEKLIWYPTITMHSSYFMYMVHFIIVQMIPALTLDALLFLSGNKTFMTKLQMKFYTALVGFSHFTSNNFIMKIKNSQMLFGRMSEVDKKNFDFDVEAVSCEEQVRKFIRGTRKFIFHETEETIPKAQKKLRKLYWANIAVSVLFTAWILNLLQKLF